MTNEAPKEDREKDLQETLMSGLRSIINRQIHHTSFQEVALQALNILGKEYSLIRENKGWTIFVNSSFSIIFEYSELSKIIANPANLAKAWFKVHDFREHYHKKLDHAAYVCQTIEQVIKNQHSEQIAQEEERIEREEEIRAKYRNWR